MSIAMAVTKRRIESDQQSGCKLGRLIPNLNTEDKEALLYAIEAVREDAAKPVHRRFFTIAWLVELLNSNGYSIGKTVVSEHLGKVCACEHSSE